jgi:prepilin-type N-terminal cleavage/methylation domain-containing protein
MMRIPRPESQRGMSLIEVMVALLVSAIGLFGALALIGTLLKGGDFSRRMTEASVLAQLRLEELVSLKYDCLKATFNCTSGVVPSTFYFPSIDTNNCTTPPGMPSAPSENIDSLGNPYVSGGTQFTRAWDACTPATSRKRIYVFVKWTDAVGPHTVTLSRERSQ